MATIQAYPLAWPVDWKRTAPNQRQNGRFKKVEKVWRPGSAPGAVGYYNCNNKWLTVTDGVGRVLLELERMGIGRDDVIVSTNVRTRLDGLPRSGEKEPEDTGASVYWQPLNSKEPMRCMAIDRYASVADNLAAIEIGRAHV